MLRYLAVVPSTESWSELLLWVNARLPAEAPNGRKVQPMHRVEECGHGVPYVLLLPTMLPVVHAPLLSARVKVPAKTDFEAVANLSLMQAALRRNGIALPDVLMRETQRLISGNFQANLLLLQWFRGLDTALQRCGIQAGEGRVLLPASSNSNSASSIHSPPAHMKRVVEEPPHAIVVDGGANADTPVRNSSEARLKRESLAAGTQGAAAAAAAVAVLRESLSRPLEGNDTSTSLPPSSVRLSPAPRTGSSPPCAEVVGAAALSQSTPPTAESHKRDVSQSAVPSSPAASDPASSPTPPASLVVGAIDVSGSEPTVLGESAAGGTTRAASSHPRGSVIYKSMPSHLDTHGDASGLGSGSAVRGAPVVAAIGKRGAATFMRRPSHTHPARTPRARRTPRRSSASTHVMIGPRNGTKTTGAAVSAFTTAPAAATPETEAATEAATEATAAVLQGRLQAIRGLVDRLEARKLLQRQHGAIWDPRDAEMMAFTASIRQVLDGASL
ncbi:hypothetical protein NESM_000352200 [Novymonas esmeraldas]|uniref:Calponin-homology (CH) domain-containing protein n=1 Tax=Novymonas esmeraldas TaxID=1808958 RepID=A0AAW0EJW0_9TRYP